MRKNLLFLILGLMCLTARAIPADPTPMQVLQPDGSRITVVLHGDEFFNYLTTSDGYTVVKNEAGYYTYAHLEGNRLVAGKLIARDEAQRTAADKSVLAQLPKGLTSSAMIQKGTRLMQHRNNTLRGIGAGGHMDYSKFRGLIILINFTDKTFPMSDPNAFYNSMINTHDYTGYTLPSGSVVSMTGSVRDYYYDNSNQMFDPSFDVLGPVNVDYSCTDPNQMSNCAPIFFAALESLDDQVDFNDYDIDKDGTVDMVFFLVAGWGSDYSSNNRKYLWPHMFNFEESPVLDGVDFSLYACSTGMTGAEPEFGSGYSSIAGIGTFCHEFSHVLGLPDLYDADYSNSGGQSIHPSNWSIMASGFKSNNGRNPVGYSLYERYALGFASPTVINAAGSYSMQALDTSSEGFRLNTAVEDEYFLIENRQAGKWDKNLPGHGMLVFRVDSTNVDVWENNKINIDPSHNYYELLRASYNGWSDSGRDSYPGTYGITSITNMTSPSLRSWNGELNRYAITDITEADNIITFNVVRDYTACHIEDFEQMPVSDNLNEQGVEGVFANWNFTNCSVVDTAQVGAACGQTVAMMNGSKLNTAAALDFTPVVVRYTVYNPTATSALFTVTYSIDNGTRWREPDNATISAAANSTAIGTVSLPTDAPLMLRISQTSGSTTEACYLDDIMLYYEGPVVPDFILGDVDDSGQVDVDDVTHLVNALLGGDYSGINMLAANLNGDGNVDIDDVTYLINLVLNP